MPKIPKCDHCSFYAHNPHLICTVHPGGVENDCLDFRDNGQEAELWSPQGYVWYGDNLQAVGRSRLTNEQRLEILDTHPLFTSKKIMMLKPLNFVNSLRTGLFPLISMLSEKIESLKPLVFKSFGTSIP